MPFKPVAMRGRDGEELIFIVPVDADLTEMYRALSRGRATEPALAQARNWNTAVWICTALNELEGGNRK